MYINSKGSIRLVMPSGNVEIQEVKRIIVGKIQDPRDQFPMFWTRTIRVETEQGLIEIALMADMERSLRMEAEGGMLTTLKKQLRG